jgi:hypothetical protein
VALPKGVYTVAASSDTSGEVRVPVAIEAGKMTVVRLETERDWERRLLKFRVLIWYGCRMDNR